MFWCLSSFTAMHVSWCPLSSSSVEFGLQKMSPSRLLVFSTDPRSFVCAHHAVCVPILELHVCCFVFFLFSCGWFVTWACSHSPLFCSSFSFSTPPSSSVIAFFQTIQLRTWSHRFVWDTRATHCPCQLKTRQYRLDTPTCPWFSPRCSRAA